MVKKTYLIIIVFIVIFIHKPIFSKTVKGIWVTCEGSNNSLSTPQKIKQIIEISKLLHINDIFLQVYRHNRAWYKTQLADPAPYNNFVKEYHKDPLSLALQLAHKHNIKVHVWINVYRIGKSKNVPIITKLGKNIITRDGRNKSLLDYPIDRLPDGGYWLDPGSKNVRNYIKSIVLELTQYPIDGIHLDYIRYPSTKFAPGSRLSRKEDLGYGKESVYLFTKTYGYSPLKMDLSDRIKTDQWDNWRRNQVTQLIKELYTISQNKNIKLSCAVRPWISKAFLVVYQDWTLWLKANIVDFVVMMNYTADQRFAYIHTLLGKYLPYKSPVYSGLGVYLMIKNPSYLYTQIKDCHKLESDGIVLFAYDELLKNKSIIKTLANTDWFSSSEN